MKGKKGKWNGSDIQETQFSFISSTFSMGMGRQCNVSMIKRNNNNNNNNNNADEVWIM